MIKNKRNSVTVLVIFVLVFAWTFKPILFVKSEGTSSNVIPNNELLDSDSLTTFVPEDEILLAYTEKTFLFESFPEMEKENIGRVLDVHTVDNISQTFYVPLENDENGSIETYSYITVNNKDYFLGQSMDKIEEEGIERFSLTRSTIHNEVKIYEWKEVLGVNYIKTLFLVIQDEIPQLITEMDGWARHIDMDQDGQVETVTTVGTVPNTTLYKWDFKKESISFVNMNDATGYDAVLFDEEENGFKLYKDGVEHRYTYKTDKLYLQE